MPEDAAPVVKGIASDSLEEGPDEPVADGAGLTGSVLEWEEFREGTLATKPEGMLLVTGVSDDDKPIEDRSADVGPDARVPDDDTGPLVKGTDAEELDGGLVVDVKFQRPFEKGKPDDGRPEEGNKDMG